MEKIEEPKKEKPTASFVWSSDGRSTSKAELDAQKNQGKTLSEQLAADRANLDKIADPEERRRVERQLNYEQAQRDLFKSASGDAKPDDSNEDSQ